MSALLNNKELSIIHSHVLWHTTKFNSSLIISGSHILLFLMIMLVSLHFQSKTIPAFLFVWAFKACTASYSTELRTRHHSVSTIWTGTGTLCTVLLTCSWLWLCCQLQSSLRDGRGRREGGAVLYHIQPFCYES